MLTYYIDVPLSAIEQEIVIEQINSMRNNKVEHLILKQMTDLLPTNDSELAHAEIIKARRYTD